MRVRIAILVSLFAFSSTACVQVRVGNESGFGTEKPRSLSPLTNPHPTTTTTLPQEPPVAPVSWNTCTGNVSNVLQCGTVSVPINYSHPEQGTISIAVARHPASDPSARIGSLVINPGGPGASGIDDLASELSVLTPGLIDRFDIVSFDPRGVERSDPITCQDTGTQAPKRPFVDPVPTSPQAEANLLANDREFASQCVSGSGAILPYAGTVDVARDLDRIRQALGDSVLNFFGHSYGTLIGLTYLQLFPDRVRAIALDGVIDPSITLDEMTTDQAETFEASLNQFFSWCRNMACAFNEGDDPTQTLIELISNAANSPVSAGANQSAGADEIYQALEATLYSPGYWPALATALDELQHGNGADAVALADGYAKGGSTNGTDSSIDVNCLDHPVDSNLSHYESLANQEAQLAPVFGPLFAWDELTCSVWPDPPTRVPTVVNGNGAPPIMLIGTVNDPATPYKWAQDVASHLKSRYFVTWQGSSHVAYYYSSCVRSYVESYFLGQMAAPGDFSC